MNHTHAFLWNMNAGAANWIKDASFHWYELLLETYIWIWPWGLIGQIPGIISTIFLVLSFVFQQPCTQGWLSNVCYGVLEFVVTIYQRSFWTHWTSWRGLATSGKPIPFCHISIISAVSKIGFLIYLVVWHVSVSGHMHSALVVACSHVRMTLFWQFVVNILAAHYLFTPWNETVNSIYWYTYNVHIRRLYFRKFYKLTNSLLNWNITSNTIVRNYQVYWYWHCWSLEKHCRNFHWYTYDILTTSHILFTGKYIGNRWSVLEQRTWKIVLYGCGN